MTSQLRALLIVLCSVMVSLAACATGSGTTGSQDVKQQAAIEATAIIQRAEATAMVLQAQAKATAMIREAGAPPLIPATPTVQPRVVPATDVPAPTGVAISSTVASATPGAATDDASLPQVELLGVDFAAEGNYIHVQFRATPRLTRQWGQGNVYVIDEVTGIIYNGIPVAPLIGPLIGRPVRDGQVGYVMLVNTDGGLHAGSIVTVVLGNFKQEHVTVGGDR